MATSPTVQAEASEAESPVVQFWSIFWEACTKPSLAVVCAVVLLALLQFGAIVLWLTPDRLAAAEHGLWMDNPWDHPAYVTVEALRMQRADPTELGVAVVGSSSMRHAFEDHFAFEARLTKEFGGPVRLHFMPAGGQSVWESALILDYLPENFQGAVVIGVHPGRAIYDEAALTEWAENPRLGLDSETTAAVRDKLGLPQRTQSGFYFLDHMAFVSGRRTAIARNMLVGPRRYERHGRSIDKPLSETGRVWRDNGAAEKMRHWEQGGTRGTQALQELVAKLTARGIEVIVAFSPLHPNVEALHPATFRRFREMITDSARNAGARMVDLNASAALVDADFRDVFHLNAHGGRLRCEDVFADELTDALRSVQRRNAPTREEAPS